MKIVNTIQHYVKFGYKTFVVDNYVLEEPSEFDEVLKDEYVYKKGKLFKALKDTISKDENLGNKDIFVEIAVYSDETPKVKVSKEEKVNEISKIVQKSETTEDAKVENAKDSQDEKIEQTEQSVQTEQKVNNFKTKKKH